MSILPNGKSARSLFCLLTLIAISGFLLSGCGKQYRSLFDRQATMTGPGSLICPEFEEIDLVSLLDPDGFGERKYSQNKNNYTDSPPNKKIDIAFKAFMDVEYGIDTRVQRRNAIQEHIIAASNQRCTYFSNFLHTSRSGVNFALGSLATIAGTAGAIVTGVDGSRVLSGTAAIFSGVRAEFNQELFSNLATHVISNGIDLRRREVYEQIVLQGQSKPYEIYPVEAAVKDAIYYHAQCNVITGVQVAGDTIKLMENPGIDTANRMLIKLNLTKQLLMDGDKLSFDEQKKALRDSTSLLKAGTPLAETDLMTEMPIRALEIAILKVDAVLRKTKAFLEKLKENENIKEHLSDNNLDALIDKVDQAGSEIKKKIKRCNEEATEKTQNFYIAKIELEGEKIKEKDVLSLGNAEFNADKAKMEAELTTEQISMLFSNFNALFKEARNHLDEKIEKLQTNQITNKDERKKLINEAIEQSGKLFDQVEQIKNVCDISKNSE